MWKTLKDTLRRTLTTSKAASPPPLEIPVTMEDVTRALETTPAPACRVDAHLPRLDYPIHQLLARYVIQGEHDPSVLEEPLDGLYERQPIRAHWGRTHDLTFDAPLILDLNDAPLVPHAPWVRAVLVQDDPNGIQDSPFFHALESLAWGGNHVEAIHMSTATEDPRDFERFLSILLSGHFPHLEHLDIEPTYGAGAGLLGQVLRSPLGENLRTLDACEWILHDDESHGMSEDELLAQLVSLENAANLEHLNLYNGIKSLERWEALCSVELPKLAQISIGHVAGDARTAHEYASMLLDWVDSSLPNLERIHIFTGLRDDDYRGLVAALEERGVASDWPVNV